ncbi:MAG TPA: HD domain-containing protein [Actinophytocola sp.]|jgi:uncharacterized protein|nr:HD domain-containing protein [Actinophytocola sp.]
MDSSRQDVIARTAEFVRGRLGAEPTGHDWWHVDRVRRTALYIASDECADTFVVELAALLHDVDDYKFTGDRESGPRAATEWLCAQSVDRRIVTDVAEIIRRMSFRGANVDELSQSVEGSCVQDADRLDAMGAIGIARTFAYGGFVQRPIHDPSVREVMHASATEYQHHRGTTINHFHEKLLLLKKRMQTDAGRKLACERHQFMADFIEMFHGEWDFESVR